MRCDLWLLDCPCAATRIARSAWSDQMKSAWILCLFLISGLQTFAQASSASPFVIDRSKPYVYLKFDHVGPRKPLQSGEPEVGLWLSVVNNCHLPVVFKSFSMPPGVPGMGLMDEVIEDTPGLQIFPTPEEGKQIERREKERKAKHKPEGYSSEVSGIARVQPGGELLFSVPINHVDSDWHMQVEFALDLDNASISSGPFTYLPFYVWDIPKEARPK